MHIRSHQQLYDSTLQQTSLFPPVRTTRCGWLSCPLLLTEVSRSLSTLTILRYPRVPDVTVSMTLVAVLMLILAIVLALRLRGRD